MVPRLLADILQANRKPGYFSALYALIKGEPEISPHSVRHESSRKLVTLSAMH